ncbi:CaiB/BaiF CoA-transferase family protein [Aromatoleum evansii]|uniref:CaiB/BaiF CoA-transferase family protein n=1 Tax=Aromatoleum evansii TaxID=59406 RepID=A0ABZ1AST5_AROEV|nr:CaiB/BaiF CoA-transferase family protein [Aromatoleum toluclasticum]MBD5803196.1 Succinyl-CoA:(R)-benzylsuccinate CoA-transferase subunit BbsF [Azoarcus sp. Aa7]WRL48797.1 CaiB/BaiF CoA-transferase family protein [Aromatoleum evansii]
MTEGALSHLRVLDLSRVLAGPWAGQTLADLGADVIKVERPGSGDDTRGWGPPYLKDRDGEDTREAAYYLAANRGKRSVTIDITRPEGQALVRELAAESDILIENYKVGALARYGLGYEDIRKLNSRLIYCSITGFGQNGPLAEIPGYDFIIQAMGGMMSITGERDELPGGGPQKLGIAFADLMTGMYATVAILAALAHRDVSGTGQYIDMALLDVQVASMSNMNLNYLTSGRVPGRHGNAHANIVPYQVFPAQDLPFVVAAGNDGQFAKLAAVVGRPELAVDPRFATNAGRVRHREELIPLLEALFRERPAQHWIDALGAAGVPSGPINDIAQALDHPQVRHRGMRIELPHPQAGTVPLVASPFKLSTTPVRYDRPPPLLGEHTREILANRLGRTSAEIEALHARGVI